MNLCELRLYNSADVLVDKIDFTAFPFSAPFNLRIPKAQRRQVETGSNMFSDGSSISSSKFDNAVITLQLTAIINCAEDDAARNIENLRYRIDYFLAEARYSTIRRGYNYVRFAEDTKGFVLESEIIDGQFDLRGDWSWDSASQGIIAESELVLTRKPFRINPQIYTVRNLIRNNEFELGWYKPSTTNRPVGYSFGGGGATYFADEQVISLTGTRSIKVVNNGNTTAGGSAFVQGFLGYSVGGTSDKNFPDNTLLYAEAWVAVTSQTNPTRRKAYFKTPGGNIYWTAADNLANANPRWYARKDTTADTDARESKNMPYFVRKGIFFYGSFNSEFDFGWIDTDGAGGNPATITCYFDKLYCCFASDFLSASQINLVKSKVVSVASNVGLVVDPTNNPSDIEWMPKGYCSSTWPVNPSYASNDNATVNYVDFSGVDGDIPAKLEMLWDYDYAATAAVTGYKSVIAGLRSYGPHTDNRKWLVRPLQKNTPIPSSYFFDYIGKTNTESDSAVTLPSTTGIMLTTCTAGAQYNDTPFVGDGTSFAWINTGRGANNLAGTYHLILRYTANLNSDLLRFRYVAQRLAHQKAKYIYGKDVSATLLNVGTLLTTSDYALADLGTITIPDIENEDARKFAYNLTVYDPQATDPPDQSLTTKFVNGMTIFIQPRVLVGGGTTNVWMDALYLIPADEWFLEVSSSIKTSYWYHMRVGNILGRDDAIGSYTSEALGNGAGANGYRGYMSDAYVGGQPYLVPGKTNRVTLLFQNPFASDASRSVNYRLFTDTQYYLRFRYREQYL